MEELKQFVMREIARHHSKLHKCPSFGYGALEALGNVLNKIHEVEKQQQIKAS